MNHLPSDAEAIVSDLVLGPAFALGGLVAAATALFAIGLTGNRPGAVAWTPPAGRQRYQRPQTNWQRNQSTFTPPARVNAASSGMHTFISNGSDVPYIIRR